jgi:tetrahydromethanopterin S-methyltransferase subunit B
MMNDNNDRAPEAILWSAICRGDKILAEAGSADNYHEVTCIATSLLKKKDTPGWEFYAQRRSPCKGIKFHVYDRDSLTGDIIIWKFAAVYDSNTVKKDQVMSFLEKLSVITEMQRQEDYGWRYGDVLAAQETFAPTLQQRMQEVAYMGRYAMVNEKIDGVKEVMASNIEMILANGESLEDMQDKATNLEKAAQQFRKRAKDVKRFRMWQNAKYGLVVGTTVTGVVALVIIPPLIALL